MYKELKASIKDYVPTESDIENIANNFLNHSFIHSGDNLLGEKYEAWVYEYLKLWASKCPDVSKFVIKTPSNTEPVQDGLGYDKNGQIVYFKKGKKIAEYDGLFIYKNRVVFVESSVSELRSYFSKLKERVVKKRELLVGLFNTEEVYYLVVTRPKKKSLAYRSLPHLVLYTLKNPNYSELSKTERVYKENSKNITLDLIFSSFS